MAHLKRSPHKLCRWLGEPICTNVKCPSRRRPYAPGVHGPAYAQRRRKVSEYGTQLLEKQKAKGIYGLREHQFRRVYELAAKKQSATDITLLELLERRLDNMIFRAGFATTRAQARQLVSHGHFLLNGRRVTVPSIVVDVNDEVKVRKANTYFEKNKDVTSSNVPSWLKVDRPEGSARVVALPAGDELPVLHIDARKIVGFYSK